MKAWVSIVSLALYLCLFASHAGAVTSHSDSEQSGLTNEVNPETSALEKKVSSAEKLQKELKKRFENKETFGATSEDVETERALNEAFKEFFKEIRELGIRESFGAHFGALQGLEKEFQEIKRTDPDRQKKEDEILQRIRDRYDRLFSVIEDAEKKNQEDGAPKPAEAFISAKDYLKLVAAIRQNIMNMRKTTGEQGDGGVIIAGNRPNEDIGIAGGKPKPSPDPIRTSIGIGGGLIAGPIGGLAAQLAYDMAMQQRATPSPQPSGGSVNHERPFVDTKPTTEPPVSEQKPQAQKPGDEKLGKEKPLDEKAPKEEAKPEKLPDTTSAAKPNDEPTHKPKTPNESSSSTPNESAASSGSFPDSTSVTSNEGASTNRGGSIPSFNSGAASGFGNGSNGFDETSPSGTSGPNGHNSGTSNSFSTIRNGTSAPPKVVQNFGAENPPSTIPSGFAPGRSPDSPFRPGNSGVSSFPSLGFPSAFQETGPLTNSKEFFAPPTRGTSGGDLNAPLLQEPGQLKEPERLPIPGVEGPRQAAGPVNNSADGVANPVRSIARGTASIPSTPFTDYKPQVYSGTGEVEKSTPSAYQPPNFDTFNPKKPTAGSGTEMDSPYVYTPGFVPVPEIPEPSMKIGDLTVFLGGGTPAPTADEIKLASGLASALSVLNATPSLTQNTKGVLESLQAIGNVTHPGTQPTTPGEKSRDLGVFLRQVKRSKPDDSQILVDAITKLTAALQGR